VSVRIQRGIHSRIAFKCQAIAGGKTRRHAHPEMPWPSAAASLENGLPRRSSSQGPTDRPRRFRASRAFPGRRASNKRDWLESYSTLQCTDASSGVAYARLYPNGPAPRVEARAGSVIVSDEPLIRSSSTQYCPEA
jgi:hypothetical protein